MMSFLEISFSKVSSMNKRSMIALINDKITFVIFYFAHIHDIIFSFYDKLYLSTIFVCRRPLCPYRLFRTHTAYTKSLFNF